MDVLTLWRLARGDSAPSLPSVSTATLSVVLPSKQKQPSGMTSHVLAQWQATDP